MDTQKKLARLAGLIYLVVVLTGIFSLAYAPSKLVDWEDAGKTFQNISASRQLFRLSIASSMLCYIAFLILPLVLYRLLHSVNEPQAKLMVIFAVVSVPISLINLQNKFAVLTLVNGADYLKTFTVQQLQSQVMTFLDTYNSGILIVKIFWGLWLFPFGHLVYKSNFLPRILGIFLMIGCFGYLAAAFLETTIAGFDQYPISRFLTLPASIGEIGTCLWLLIFGTKNKVINIPAK